MITVLLIDYIQYFMDLVTGKRTRAELSAAASRKRDISAYIDLDTVQFKVLDLANGELRPQSYILRYDGHDVVGVDYVNKHELSIKRLLYVFARFIFCLHIPRAIVKKPGRAKFIACDVASIPLESDSIDLITSIAAFEHFLDVPAVVKECHRVLRQGGFAWICIHVFTAPSGGHNVGRRLTGVHRLPDGIEPWDHLRQRRLPFSVPLNEWRIDQYRQEFAKYFTIEKCECIGREGEKLLTPEIIGELSEYTTDELTCGALLILARKE